MQTPSIAEQHAKSVATQSLEVLLFFFLFRSFAFVFLGFFV